MPQTVRHPVPRRPSPPGAKTRGKSVARSRKTGSARAASAVIGKTRNDANLRIDRETDRTLDALAKATGEAKKAIVARAVDRMRREQLFSAANEGYAELRENQKVWAKEMKERELLDSAVADGLESE